MDPINRYSLEDFTERHRADFDLHEPRPELWDALATQLEAQEAGSRPGPVRMSVVAEAPAAPEAPTRALPAATPAPPQLRTQRRGRWQWAGMAAALVVLLAAAGAGEFWKTHRPAVAVASREVTGRRAGPDAALYLGDDTGALAASQGGPNGNTRLDTAVHGMERYYVSQLADRQAQLSQLAPEQAAEWTRELVSLDSSYQQLKRELPQHPQPELVLTEMNRNLQIRLDILDQQLELRGGSQLARGAGSTGGEYVLADSRGVASEAGEYHAR